MNSVRARIARSDRDCRLGRALAPPVAVVERDGLRLKVRRHVLRRLQSHKRHGAFGAALRLSRLLLPLGPRIRYRHRLHEAAQVVRWLQRRRRREFGLRAEQPKLVRSRPRPPGEPDHVTLLLSVQHGRVVERIVLSALRLQQKQLRVWRAQRCAEGDLGLLQLVVVDVLSRMVLQGRHWPAHPSRSAPLRTPSCSGRSLARARAVRRAHTTDARWRAASRARRGAALSRSDGCGIVVLWWRAASGFDGGHVVVRRRRVVARPGGQQLVLRPRWRRRADDWLRVPRWHRWNIASRGRRKGPGAAARLRPPFRIDRHVEDWLLVAEAGDGLRPFQRRHVTMR